MGFRTYVAIPLLAFFALTSVSCKPTVHHRSSATTAAPTLLPFILGSAILTQDSISAYSVVTTADNTSTSVAVGGCTGTCSIGISNSTGPLSVSISGNTVNISATGNSSCTITVSDGPSVITISILSLAPPVASQLVLTAVPGSVTAGGSFNVTVTARDVNNNVVTNYPGTVSITSTDGQAVLPASSTLTNGTKTFAVTLKTAVSSTVTAGDGSLSVTSSGITVNPATYSAAQSLVTASAATLLSGASITATLTAKDAYGNSNPTGLPVVGSIAFTSTSNAGTGSFGSVTAAGSGVYTSSFTGATAGAVTLGATISAAAVSNNATVTVNPGAATQLILTSVPGSSTAGDSFNITVTAKDASNNIVTGYAETVSITSSDGQAVLPSSSTLTSGTKVFAVTLKTAASKTVTAGDGTLSVTSSGITINPAAYDVTQSVVTASASTVVSAASITATLTTKDAYGNLNPTGLPVLGSIAFTSSSNAGTGSFGSVTAAGSGVYTSSFTGDVAGSVTVGATISTVAVSTNATVTVTASTPFAGRPTVDCGTTGGIFTRIANCAIANGATASYVGTGAETTWALVTRLTDTGIVNELWRDSATGLVWSDNSISLYKWFAAAGYSSSVSTTSTTYYEGQAGGANQPANPVSVCTAANTLNLGSGTNGLTNYVNVAAEEKIKGYLTSVNWRLPSSTEFDTGNTHGSRGMLPNLTANRPGTSGSPSSRYYWSSDAVLNAVNNRGVFMHETAGYALATNIGLDNPWFTVRCVSDGSPVPGGTAATKTAMNYEHVYQTATLLGSGKVVIAGGYGTGLWDKVELYDPAAGAGAGSSTTMTALAVGRHSHTATLLSDGKILFVGGSDVSYNGTLSSVELYDPAANAGAGGTTSLAALPVNLAYHIAILLSADKVLLVGGKVAGNASAGVYLYDPNANSGAGGVTTLTSLITARLNHTATLLPNGTILVAGGSNTAGTSLAEVEIYDPSGAGTATAATALNTARLQPSASLMSSGKVLIAGGMNTGGTTIGTVELYNPAGGTPVNATPMITARRVHTATLLADDRILFAGGITTGSTSISAVEIYDINAGVGATPGMTTAQGDLNTRRRNHTATLLSNGSVLTTGGNQDTTKLLSVELITIPQ